MTDPPRPVLLAVLAAMALVACGTAAVAATPAVSTPSHAGESPTTLPIADEPAEGRTLATPPNGSADAELLDGGTYFLGQVLWTDAFDSGDDVALRRADGTLVREVPVGDDGRVVLRTGDRSPGEYVMAVEGGPTLAFELVRQDYGVETSRSLDGGDVTLTVRIQSNRDSYRQAISSPDLSAATLRSAFGVGTVTDADGDGADELVVEGGVDRTLTADLGSLDPGRYAFEFAVTDATANETLRITVPHVEEGRAEFGVESNVVVEERGDVARIPVALRNADRANLTVGSADLGWAVRATVVDGDGDGEVAVLVDTDLAARVADPARVVRALDGSVRNVTRTAGAPFSDPDRRLAADSYPMAVGVGDGPSNPGMLVLRDPDAVERRLGVARARRGLSNSTVLDAARAAPFDDGTGGLAYGRSVTVARGDHLAVGIRLAGVFGALSRAESPTDTPAGVSLRIAEVSTGPNEEPDAVDPGTFSVATNPPDNRIALVADTADPDFETGETYRVTLEVTPESPYVDETVRRSATFTVVSRRASVDVSGDRLRVMAVENATVSGTATVADGTRLTVRIRSTGTGPEDAEPFLHTRRVTVENGAWSTTFDLSGAMPGQRFRVEVNGIGNRTGVRGVVTRPASATLDDWTAKTTHIRVVTVDSVSLPDGGFVTIHARSSSGFVLGRIVGVSGYLPPGRHRNVSVTLDEPLPVDGSRTVVAVAYRDSDGDRVSDVLIEGDPPYVVGGTAVRDRANASAGVTSTPTHTPTPTPPPTDQCPPTCQPTTNPSPTPTPSPTTTGQIPDSTPTTTDTPNTHTDAPGFGAGVALVALLVAALLAVRRRD